MSLNRFLDWVLGHKWQRVDYGEPERGDPEWGQNRYGGALVSLRGFAILRQCKRCGLIQQQTNRIWGKGLTFKSVWSDV